MKTSKGAELREQSETELNELGAKTSAELFQARMANFTNQLDDSSKLNKGRRAIARIKTELRRRELEELNQQVKKALAAQADTADESRK